MTNLDKPRRSIIGASIATILSLVAVQALLQTPVLGLLRGTTLGDPGLNERFSIAAIAVPLWVMCVIIAQLVMLLMPTRWSRPLGRDGLVNPFGWAALGLTALLGYSYEVGIAGSLRALALIEDTQQGMILVIASLYLGTAGIIFAGWIIDRFGSGHGFWIIVASKAVIDLTTGVMQAASLLSMHGLVGALAPTAAR
jgi:preprotein translocase subunit SecY